MSLLDRLISQVVPHDCLGCGREGRLLCAACRSMLRPVSPGCYRCRTPAADYLACLECRAENRLYQVRAATLYEGLAKDLVWKLKSGHAQAAAGEIAAVMRPLLDKRSRNDYLVVPVPTATTRMRQRGYDQACLLARELAKRTRQPWAEALARHSQAHQVGAGRQQRVQQLAGAFRVTRPHLVRGARIILVDDVVTTGATLEAAAAALHQAGAAHIEAVTFAQPALRRRQL